VHQATKHMGFWVKYNIDMQLHIILFFVERRGNFNLFFQFLKNWGKIRSKMCIFLLNFPNTSLLFGFQNGTSCCYVLHRLHNLQFELYFNKVTIHSCVIIVRKCNKCNKQRTLMFKCKLKNYLFSAPKMSQIWNS